MFNSQIIDCVKMVCKAMILAFSDDLTEWRLSLFKKEIGEIGK